MNRLQRWWRRRLLRKHRIPISLWISILSHAAVVASLSPTERHRLRILTSRFMRKKSIVGAQGLEVNDTMRVIIAAQACLLILNLDLAYYDGWREIIVYPDSFVTDREEHDAAGVVHRTRHTLGGESWGRGPVILSWHDSQPGVHPHGTNVILHEFAHKIDMLNGAANGMPPLHIEMSRPAWTAALTSAFNDLRQHLQHHHPTAIDPYAATNPAEFFAVVTENFFERPHLLQQSYPRVYALFKQFYRQDPLLRIDREQTHP